MMFDDDDDVGMQVDSRAESQTCSAGPLCLDLDAKPKMPCESGGGGTSGLVWGLGRNWIRTATRVRFIRV